MTVFDDLGAEQDRLAGILGGLDEAQWTSASGAAGWTIADVVLHLAQSEEGVVASVGGSGLREATAAAGTVDDWAAQMVDAERAAAAQVFTRWRRARDAAAAVGISRQTLQAWIISGKVKAPKPTGSWKTAARMWSAAEVQELRRLKKQIYQEGKGRKK